MQAGKLALRDRNHASVLWYGRTIPPTFSCNLAIPLSPPKRSLRYYPTIVLLLGFGSKLPQASYSNSTVYLCCQLCAEFQLFQMASKWLRRYSLCNEAGCGPGSLLGNNTAGACQRAIHAVDKSRAITGNMYPMQSAEAVAPGSPISKMFDVHDPPPTHIHIAVLSTREGTGGCILLNAYGRDEAIHRHPLCIGSKLPVSNLC